MAAVARRIGLDRRLERIQRQARGPVGVGMNVDIDALAIGAPNDIGKYVRGQ